MNATATENTVAAADAVTEQAAPAAAKGKTEKTGDVILDNAIEIENLSKTKAINEVGRLSDNIDQNSFRLGGVLTLIFKNQWFEGHATFAEFVGAKLGFAERKARYLMEIYQNLVDKQIPWAKVQGLGWTKLKELARHLTAENVDEWVAKASAMTVVELQLILKGPEAAGKEKTVTGASDTMTYKVKLKGDQYETLQAGLAKAKSELNTEFDSVALENVMAGFLGGSVATVKASGLSLIDAMKAVGWEAALMTFGEVFPGVDLTVNSVPEGDGTVAEGEAEADPAGEENGEAAGE